MVWSCRDSRVNTSIVGTRHKRHVVPHRPFCLRVQNVIAGERTAEMRFPEASTSRDYHCCKTKGSSDWMSRRHHGAGLICTVCRSSDTRRYSRSVTRSGSEFSNYYRGPHIIKRGRGGVVDMLSAPLTDTWVPAVQQADHTSSAAVLQADHMTLPAVQEAANRITAAILQTDTLPAVQNAGHMTPAVQEAGHTPPLTNRIALSPNDWSPSSRSEPISLEFVRQTSFSDPPQSSHYTKPRCNTAGSHIILLRAALCHVWRSAGTSWHPQMMTLQQLSFEARGHSATPRILMHTCNVSRI
jgi:hypothetical protein